MKNLLDLSLLSKDINRHEPVILFFIIVFLFIPKSLIKYNIDELIKLKNLNTKITI